jgi:hypothetical protein
MGMFRKLFYYIIRLFSNERIDGNLLCKFFKSMMFCVYKNPKKFLPYTIPLEKNRFI